MEWTCPFPFVRVSGRIPADIYTTLVNTLRYRPKDYRFRWAYQHHTWDGYESLLVTEPGTKATVFPIGVVPRVRQALGSRIGYLIPAALGGPTPLPIPAVPTTLPNGTVLRPEQVTALGAALTTQRGLLHLSVNFGKTLIIAGIATAWPNSRVVILLNRRTLLEQTTRDLRDFLQEPIATWGAGGYQPRAGARILVAMVQSANPGDPHWAKWREAPILLVDEAHTISPIQWFPILGSSQATVRLGMSGSLLDVPIPLLPEAFLGPVFHTVQDQALAEAGRSADLTVYMPRVTGFDAAGDAFRDVYETGIVKNDRRNRVLVDLILLCARAACRTLVLVAALKHGDALLRACEAQGLRGAWLHGSTPLPEIERALGALTARRLDVLIASTIFSSGINIPEADVLINAAAWKSPLATGQKRGRIIRLKPWNPNKAILIDPYDIGHPWLERHSLARKRLYAKKGSPVIVGSQPEITEAVRAELSSWGRTLENVTGI